MIAKQKGFSLAKIGEDGILGPKKQKEEPKKRSKSSVEDVILSSLDDDYTYHDKEDYQKLDEVRYTNPETGKPILSKSTENAYKKLDKTFYAMKESEDSLMAKLRQFESEADAKSVLK